MRNPPATKAIENMFVTLLEINTPTTVVNEPVTKRKVITSAQ